MWCQKCSQGLNPMHFAHTHTQAHPAHFSCHVAPITFHNPSPLFTGVWRNLTLCVPNSVARRHALPTAASKTRDTQTWHTCFLILERYSNNQKISDILLENLAYLYAFFWQRYHRPSPIMKIMPPRCPPVSPLSFH